MLNPYTGQAYASAADDPQWAAPVAAGPYSSQGSGSQGRFRKSVAFLSVSRRGLLTRYRHSTLPAEKIDSGNAYFTAA